MIGVYFHFESRNSFITGYVSAGGELTILQLISLHIEFYLGLTYASDLGVIWGEADLSVEVTLAFLHKSVTLTMRREFQVGRSQQAVPAMKRQSGTREITAPASFEALASAVPGDTSIKTMLSEDDWKKYAAAFA
jgi:hypothetical protein